jgi:hypothetical protein
LKLPPKRSDSEESAEGFAREQHKCQSFGGFQGRSRSAGRILKTRIKFCIETLAQEMEGNILFFQTLWENYY